MTWSDAETITGMKPIYHIWAQGFIFFGAVFGVSRMFLDSYRFLIFEQGLVW
jgi:hypothetical protein